MVSDAGTSKSFKETSPVNQNVEPSLRISLHDAQGQLVTRLEAADPDEGINGRVTYELRRHGQSRIRINRAAGDFLNIDANTGEVWLRRALQEEDLGLHVFVVSATDQGEPLSRSESKVMVVSVEDILPRALGGGGASSSYIASADRNIDEGGVLANLFPFKHDESKNVVILIGLVSISVILAVALVAAMICMLKPYRLFSRQSRRFFNHNQMSPESGLNSASLQARASVEGRVISLQETRLIDNISIDNFGGGVHDYGYGATLSPVDTDDRDNWMGGSTTGGTVRILNGKNGSPVGNEIVGRSQPWNKYNSLPRANCDHCGSPSGQKEESVCAVTTTAGVPLTPLSEINENAGEPRIRSQWALMKLAFEPNNSESQIALPVTLLTSTSGSFITPTSVMTTTFRPSAYEKFVTDYRMTEHASDSGQGESDEDFRSQALTHSLPIAIHSKLPFESSEDNPWKMVNGEEALSSEDYVYFQRPAVDGSSKNLSTDDMAVVNHHY